MQETAFRESVVVYGLTTEEAVRAFRDGRLDRLSASNRWKFALVDHAYELHQGAMGAFNRICLACKREDRVRAA